MPFRNFRFAQRTYQRQTVISVRSGSREFAFNKTFTQLPATASSILSILFIGSQIKISPINTDIISFFSQHFLITTTGFQKYKIFIYKAFCRRRLSGKVHRPLRRSLKIKFDSMLLPISRSHSI